MKNNLPKLGKIHPNFFNRHIYPKLGKPDKSISEGTLLATANNRKAKFIEVDPFWEKFAEQLKKK